MPVERVCLGRIVGAHGVRGMVRIKPFTEVPEDVDAYGPLTDGKGERTFDVTVSGPHKGTVLAWIDGVQDRDAAERLRGTDLCVPRDRLPEAGADDEGAVVTVDGTDLGRVLAVHDFGAGDVVEAGGAGRQPVLVPFTAEAVPEIDLDGGRLVVDPPPGLLETPTQAEQEGRDVDDGDGNGDGGP